MEKAQVSVEFMIIASAALVIFLVFLSGYNEKIGPLQSNKRRVEAHYLSQKAANSINDVFLSGEGTSTTVYFPTYFLGGENYNITIYPKAQSVFVNWTTGEAGEKFLTPNVTGQFTKGENKLINEDGVIHVE